MSAARLSARRAALIGAAVAALVATPSPAWAQPFGPGACGGGCYYADNSNETFFYNGLTVDRISVSESGRARVEATDMTTTLQTASYNSDTDIVVSDDSYGTAKAPAWWVCTALVSGSTTKCNQGQVVYNLSWGNAPVPLSCQEFGHGIGLDHSTSTGSCMYQNASVAATDFDAHDKGHINGYY